jgi:hypothetical protein
LYILCHEAERDEKIGGAKNRLKVNHSASVHCHWGTFVGSSPRSLINTTPALVVVLRGIGLVADTNIEKRKITEASLKIALTRLAEGEKSFVQQTRKGGRGMGRLQLCSHAVIGLLMLLLDSSACGLFKWRTHSNTYDPGVQQDSLLRIRYYQLVIGALELRHVLEPQPILQLYIMLDEIKAVGEAQITIHNARGRRRFYFAIDAMPALEMTIGRSDHFQHSTIHEIG